MHQTVGNVLRTLLHTHRPKSYSDAAALVDDALATAIHSLRCSTHSTLRTTPGAIAFNHDMLLNLPLQADLIALQKRRQHVIDQNLLRMNAKRRSFDYQPGQEVLILDHEADKLDPKAVGPYTILRVHTNGTVTLRMTPDVSQRINIRRIKPFNRS